MDNLYDVSSSYQTQQQAVYTHNLSATLRTNLTELIDDTTEYEAGNASNLVQNTIYQSFSNIETMVRNDLGLSQTEQNDIIMNFTIIRSLILSNDFIQIINSLVGGTNVISIESGSTHTESLGSFLKQVARYVVAAAIVVAGTFVGVTIGHFLEDPVGIFALGGLLTGVHYASKWLDYTDNW